MESNKKRVSVKSLKHHIFKRLSIHPELKTDSDISSKKIDNIIEKKCGKDIDQKVPMSCISSIVEELIDEIDKD